MANAMLTITYTKTLTRLMSIYPKIYSRDRHKHIIMKFVQCKQRSISTAEQRTGAPDHQSDELALFLCVDSITTYLRFIAFVEGNTTKRRNIT
jgi:hypothetical protein